MHILPNIPQSKGNQAMKFDQLKEYNKRNIFKNHAENEIGILVSDHFLFCKKALYEMKTSDLHLSLKIF